MSDYFLGEIRLFPYNGIPNGWAACHGQLLPIMQNQALYTLLGTVYGGDGRTTFGLPDLQGRTPYGTAATTQGTKGGTESVTLALSNLPPHTHNVFVNSQNGTKAAEANNFLAANAQGATPGAAPFNVYAPLSGNPAVALNSASVTNAGSSQAHENRQPSLALSYCIALSGLYPTRG
jgi:microcystin-dependent protein